MRNQSRSQLWLYVAVMVGVVLLVIVFGRLLAAGFQAYLALIAGSLLLVGNCAEIVRAVRTRTLGIPAMNLLIALALILFFVGKVLGTLVFWPLSIVALVLAVPLATQRAGVARAYVRSARSLAAQARTLWRMRQRMM